MNPYLLITNAQGDTLKRLTDFIYNSESYPGVAPIIKDQVWIVISHLDAHRIREELSLLIEDHNMIMIMELGRDFSAQRISGGLRDWISYTRQQILGENSDIQ